MIGIDITSSLARYKTEHAIVEQNLKNTKQEIDMAWTPSLYPRSDAPDRITIKELFDAMPPDVQRKISCYDLKRIVDNLNP